MKKVSAMDLLDMWIDLADRVKRLEERLDDDGK
jgi:hypothetical protein